MKLSEFELINRIACLVSQKSKGLICGMGDDAAVFKVRPKWFGLLTADCLVEKIDFDRKYCSPFEVGFKSLSVNVSDIAAMGGKPLWAVVSLAFPQKTSEKTIGRFYHGLRRAAGLYGVGIVGGDLSRSSKEFFCNIALYGEVRTDYCKFRKGAGIGDAIYVTGSLGQSSLGLHLLEKNHRDHSIYSRVHKMPVAQMKAGLFLGSCPEVTSLIDLSDGLLADLGHVCEQSGVGAVLEWKLIPRPKNLAKIASALKKSEQEFVLAGGEDFQLLFTVFKKEEALFERKMRRKGHQFYKIGRIVAKKDPLRACLRSGKSGCHSEAKPKNPTRFRGGSFASAQDDGRVDPLLKNALRVFDKSGKTIRVRKKGYEHFR